MDPKEGLVATMAFLWKNILTVHDNPGRRYIDYSNALDCLTPSFVSSTFFEVVSSFHI